MTASVCQQEPREAAESQRGSDWTYQRKSMKIALFVLKSNVTTSPSSNRVPSLSIALDTHLFLLILWLLSSALLFARLPHGNLGEPSTRHTLRSPRI